MDPVTQVLIAAIVCGSAALIVKVVVSGALRMQQLKRGAESPVIEERLARIEAAVDAIAIEVERAGELQRFTARLAEKPRLSGGEPPTA